MSKFPEKVRSPAEPSARSIPIRRSAAGLVYRLVHLDSNAVGQHRHDGVSVSVPILGVLRASFEGQEQHVARGGVIVHPSDTMHAGKVEWTGIEAVELELDPEWLTYIGVRQLPVTTLCMSTGALAGEARTFARCIEKSPCEKHMARAARRFFDAAARDKPVPTLHWIGRVREVLLAAPRISTDELASLAGVSRQRLCEAYLHAFGESLQATARRHRVEAATLELRHSKTSLAEIAYRAGFYDQSHMNRIFMRIVGRTPLEVRSGTNASHFVPSEA